MIKNLYQNIKNKRIKNNQTKLHSILQKVYKCQKFLLYVKPTVKVPLSGLMKFDFLD